MGRKKGSKDLKKRKVRKDKKYKYRKKRLSDKFIPYIPKQNRNDKIKIWFFKVEKMSKAGYKRFPPQLRPHVRTTIYKPHLRIDVLPERMSSKREIEMLCEEIGLEEGKFEIRMFCKRKNQWGVSAVRVCTIQMLETPEGVRCKFLSAERRLGRYWFWKEGK